MLLVFAIYPLIWSLTLSFHSWELAGKPGSGWEFVGIGNYVSAIGDQRFLESLARTLLLMGSAVTLELGIGLGLALLLNQELRGTKYLRVLFLIPIMIAPVVGAFIFRIMLHPTRGPVNYLLGLVGVPVISWLDTAPFPLISILLVEIWQYAPLIMLILLAGLQGIDKSYVEAALVDGASRWQTFRHVILPLLRYVILVAILLRLIDILKIFDSIVVLTAGGPGTYTESVTYYIYLNGFRFFSEGYTAALSYLFLVVTIIISSQVIKTVAKGW